MAERTISGKIAKDLFEIVWSEGGDPRADRRSARHEAGHRRRRRSRSWSTRSSPPIPTRSEQAQREAGADRLVRRPGHEGVRRQGEPAGGERSPQGEARSLSSARSLRLRLRYTARGCVRRGVWSASPRRESTWQRRRRASSSGLQDRSEHPCLRIAESRFARFPLLRALPMRLGAAFRRDVRRFFFAAKIVLGDAAQRLARVVANAVKPCGVACARIFRHG